MTPSQIDLVKEMRARVRRHMLISFGGIGVVLIAFGVMGATAERYAVDPTLRVLFAVAGVLGLLAVPIIGFWSTLENLRCPGCGGFVGWQVSWNYSFFGNFARKTCRHCNARIFPDGLSRKVLIVAVITIAVGIAAEIVKDLLTA